MGTLIKIYQVLKKIGQVTVKLVTPIFRFELIIKKTKPWNLNQF